MPLGEPVPDLRSLDLLRSVAELGSIRQAALAHHVSQPAASTRLRTLERLFGLELLDRRGAARLTPAGLAVVQWSEGVLDEMRALLETIATVRADSRSQLRVVASMTVAEYLVPSWLNRLRVSDPGIAVSLQMGNSDHVVAVMQQHGADVGFVEGSAAPEQLTSRALLDDHLSVIVGPTHPWAGRSAVTAAELALTPMVLREVGSGTREVFEAALASVGAIATALVELGSTTAIKAAVASGVGPGVLSRLAIEHDLAAGRLVAIRVEGLSFLRSIRAVWVGGQPPALARRLLEQVETADNLLTTPPEGARSRPRPRREVSL